MPADPADVAAHLYGRDRASQHLGIEVIAVGAGTATCRMVVGPTMVNGHGVCHGGLVFTLADTAFAFACNSHGESTLAAGAHVDFVNPAPEGTVLTAVATEVLRRGRTGFTDVTVTAGDGTTIALFRGRSHTVGGAILTTDG